MLVLAVAALGAAAEPVFEPVRVAAPGPGGPLELAVWGRRIVFGDGPLPSAIESQGVALLAAPVRIAARADGAPFEIAWAAPALTSQTPSAVVLRSNGTAPGLAVAAETRVEDDGMVRVDLTVTAERPLRLDEWRYDVVLDRSLGDLFFNHHVEYDYQSFNIDKPRMLQAAGLFPMSPRRFPFMPTMFVGNRDVGLEWWSESDAAWNGPRGFRPLELSREGEDARLRVVPIGAPLVLSKGGSWRDTFALFPVPMRPPARHAESVRFLPWQTAARFDRRIGTRFFWIAFGAAFRARWHGLPTSFDDAEQRKLRRELDAAGVRFVPYGKLTIAPTLHPETMRRFDEWNANGHWVRGAPPGDEAAVLVQNGVQLRPRQPYTYAACMGSKSYLDWMLSENLAALRRERLGGLYFDHGAIARMCLRSPVLEGRRGRQVWEYFNVREFYRRLYLEVKAIDAEAQVVVHSHGQPRALAAYADFVFVGESWNGVFAGRASWEQIAHDPSLYTPDYLALPAGYLEAMLLPRIGGSFGVLPQIKPALDRDNPGRARGYQRGMLAVALADGVPVWLGNGDLDALVDVYRAVDRLGGLGDARLLPWWSNGATIRRDARLKVTAWVRDGRALLVVANWGERDLELPIEVDAARLGLEGRLRVRDAEREGRRVDVKGPIPVSVPARDFRLLLLD